MEAQVAPSLTRWFTPAALAADGWGVRYARECVRRGNPVDWAAAWRSFERLDVQDRLGSLHASGPWSWRASSTLPRRRG